MKQMSLLVFGIFYIVIGVFSFFGSQGDAGTLSNLLRLGIILFAVYRLYVGGIILYRINKQNKKYNLLSTLLAYVDVALGLVVLSLFLFNFLANTTLPIIIGIWLLLQGIMYWQFAFKQKEQRQDWWLMLIIAFTHLLLSMMYIFNVFGRIFSINTSLGIFLIYLGVISIQLYRLKSEPTQTPQLT